MESNEGERAALEPSEDAIGSFVLRRVLEPIEADLPRAADLLIKRLTWMVFLLVPLAALWLRLLFRKREPFYVPHLVMSLHMHSAVLLLLTIANLTEWLPGPDLIGATVVLWIPIYVLLSVRRAYAMGWWATIWRLTVFNMVHFGALISALMASVVLTGLSLS